MPLANTFRMSDEHALKAFECSRKEDRFFGAGGKFFIFARDWRDLKAEGNAAQASETSPFMGLSIHDADGKLLIDLSALPARDPHAKNQWRAFNASVNPGIYRLRRVLGGASAGQKVEQNIVVSAGWQTQVFLTYSYGAKYNFADTSIAMADQHKGFDCKDPAVQAGLRASEIARQNLVLGRPILSAQFTSVLTGKFDPAMEAPRPNDPMWTMLSGKFQNPMLGILGGQLLVLERRKLDEKLGRLADNSAEKIVAAARKQEINLILAEVVGNSRLLIPGHPDVEALALELTSRSIPFPNPPMLSASWTTILARCVDDDSIIAEESLSESIADRLWGEGCWLMWCVPDARTASVPFSATVDVNELLKQYSLNDPEAASNEFEASLLKYARQTQSSGATEMPSFLGGDPYESRRGGGLESMSGGWASPVSRAAAPRSESDVAEALGIPKASLRRLLGSMAAKYNESAIQFDPADAIQIPQNPSEIPSQEPHERREE